MNRPERYEEFGSEKMARLLFRMAMPMVAAQLVNLLYSIGSDLYRPSA